jgi:uncharacterized protein (TIGR00290 family)
MKNFFNWSGGKDSSLALYYALQQGVKIDLLFTTLSEKYKRISMHGVKEDLLDAQARSIGIPLKKMYLPENASMETYNELYRKALYELKEEGFETAYFGDIYLEDLKKYREDKLSEVGFKAEFPLWKIPTEQISKDFIHLGFQTKIVAINGEKLDKSFVGRDYTKGFIADLPQEIDVCGENGEFHSFCFAGPIYKDTIHIKVGEVIEKTYDLDKEKGLKSSYYFAELEKVEA